MTTRSIHVRRRMRGALGAALIVVGLSLPSLAQAQVSAELFVPSWTQQRVLVFDTKTGTFNAKLSLPGEPYDAKVTPDGRRVYVTQRAGNSVSVIDVATRAIVATIPTALTPRDVAITPDGRLAYVTMAGADLVSVFDVATNAEVASIPTLSIPWGIAITPDGKHAVVVNRMAGAVSVIDIGTQTVVAVIAVDREPVEVAIAPDGKIAYVSCTINNTVVPIDLQEKKPLPAIPVGRFPRALAVTPDGTQIFVACSDDNTVRVIDVATHVVTTVPAGVNSLPSGVAIAADGTLAFVGTQGLFVNGAWTSQVLTIDVASKTIVGAEPTNGQALRVGLGPNMIVPSAVGAALSVAGDADLTRAGFPQHIVFNGGTLRSTGNWASRRGISLLVGGGTIDTQGFTVEIDGGVFNDGTLVKRGKGDLRMGGGSTHPATNVEEGTFTLLGPGIRSGSVTVTGGSTLRGTGTVGNLDVPEGVISPGDINPAAMMRAQNVTMNVGSALVMDLRAGSPGVTYDQLAAGTAALNGATLQLRTTGSILPGATFVIVTNATGTFADLPEGAIVTVPDSLARFHITYLGGKSRHDVSLTAF